MMWPDRLAAGDDQCLACTCKDVGLHVQIDRPRVPGHLFDIEMSLRELRRGDDELLLLVQPRAVDAPAVTV